MERWRSRWSTNGESVHGTAVDSWLMGWRFRKRKRLAPGVTLNVGKRGGSFSLGRRGGTVNVGRRGAQATVSLLGTGLSYVFRRRR